jgi:flagellar basal-body rod protein FlgF
MSYGYMIGASSILTSMFRQDVAANNLANLETVGFKPDSAFTIPRKAAREEDGLFNLPSNAMLERLGAGVLLAPSTTNFRPGPITTTGNVLDLAIEGDGFFQVAAGAGGGRAEDRLRLTRDGRFTLNDQGTLVTTGSGFAVLDDTDRPIQLAGDGQITVDGSGNVRQSGRLVAKLKFVDLPERTTLRKVGDNLFAMSAASVKSRADATGRIVQGAIERSAVDPVQAMMAVQNAANAVAGATRIMQIQDELTGRAISTLGRIA